VVLGVSQGMLPGYTTCTSLQTDEHGKRQDKTVEVHMSIVTNSLRGGREGVGKIEWLEMVMTDLQLALPGSTGIVNKDILICQS